jgi:16S rRNA (cytosine1402-N4)-methyltransferase
LEQGGKVIAFDHDAEAVNYGQQMFAKEIEQGNLILIHKNFAEMFDLPEFISKKIMGILFDFGINSVQLDTAVRGFSFQEDGPLDMRMDSRLGVTARDLVNALGKKELYQLLTTYAQESHARQIVEAILRYRATKPFQGTKELADVIQRAVGRSQGKQGSHLHPATKTFMALRMAVNDELGSIERALPTALDTLADGGRMVTIAFHEGEDRLVKHAMRRWEETSRGEQLTKKPLEPSFEEIQSNPRSRSAKVRVFQKAALEKGAVAL